MQDYTSRLPQAMLVNGDATQAAEQASHGDTNVACLAAAADPTGTDVSTATGLLAGQASISPGTPSQKVTKRVAHSFDAAGHGKDQATSTAGLHASTAREVRVGHQICFWHGCCLLLAEPLSCEWAVLNLCCQLQLLQCCMSQTKCADALHRWF